MKKIGKHNYTFIHEDCFSDRQQTWDLLTGIYRDRDNLLFLEIGSFEGRSSTWFCENLLTGHHCRLICADPHPEWTFKKNSKPFVKSGLLEHIKKPSFEALCTLLTQNRENSFHFVYIDGCHLPQNVMEDAVLSFRLLKPGGILLFDDYTAVRSPELDVWNVNCDLDNPDYLPAKSVNMFADVYRDLLIKIDSVDASQFCAVKKASSLPYALICEYGGRQEFPEWVKKYHLSLIEKEKEEFEKEFQYIRQALL